MQENFGLVGRPCDGKDGCPICTKVGIEVKICERCNKRVCEVDFQHSLWGEYLDACHGHNHRTPGDEIYDIVYMVSCQNEDEQYNSIRSLIWKAEHHAAQDVVGAVERFCNPFSGNGTAAQIARITAEKYNTNIPYTLAQQEGKE